mmetsp:Transcript_18994/g.33578  ORF Transcript_18994/g.33578 Transcript_18994/m.33578 type:complete len:337 (-) Transcript_18994:703-1713(-)
MSWCETCRHQHCGITDSSHVITESVHAPTCGLDAERGSSQAVYCCRCRAFPDAEYNTSLPTDPNLKADGFHCAGCHHGLCVRCTLTTCPVEMSAIVGEPLVECCRCARAEAYHGLLREMLVEHRCKACFHLLCKKCDFGTYLNETPQVDSTASASVPKVACHKCEYFSEYDSLSEGMLASDAGEDSDEEKEDAGPEALPQTSDRDTSHDLLEASPQKEPPSSALPNQRDDAETANDQAPVAADTQNAVVAEDVIFATAAEDVQGTMLTDTQADQEPLAAPPAASLAPNRKRKRLPDGDDESTEAAPKRPHSFHLLGALGVAGLLGSVGVASIMWFL